MILSAVKKKKKILLHKRSFRIKIIKMTVDIFYHPLGQILC